MLKLENDCINSWAKYREDDDSRHLKDKSSKMKSHVKSGYYTVQNVDVRAIRLSDNGLYRIHNKYQLKALAALRSKTHPATPND